MLHRLSKFIPKSHLISVYIATIQSVFDYSITFWGSCNKTYIKQLQRFQNRCARICMNNFDYNISSHILIKQLEWMNIKTRYYYFLGILMYKFVKKQLPPTLQNLFTYVNEIHNHSTRASNSKDIALPLPRTEVLRRNLSYSGPLFYNSLSSSVRKCNSLDNFKVCLKSYLLNCSTM